MTTFRSISLLGVFLSVMIGCSSGTTTPSGQSLGGAGGSSPADGGGGTSAGGADSGARGGLEHVIVIAMENHDQASIIGNTADAPYINGLLSTAASASNFVDALPILIPSEPHYVYMEGGTATFADVTFAGDADPSATNSTSSTEHLSTQLDDAGLGWVSYQEGINGTTGACPIHSSGFYKAKHDPFIFFQDVSGSPPDAANARCAEHHKGIDAFFAAIHGTEPLPAYSFVTPDQCHDMHGQTGCPNANLVDSGDEWLSTNLPGVIAYAVANDAAVFLVWDEGELSPTIPFLALGSSVKKGYVSDVKVTHGSLVRSVETIFGLSALPTVASENDFADFFEGGAFP